MQQRARYQSLNLRLRHLEQPAHLRCINLRPANVAVRGLVLGINRDGERFDGIHVQVRHLLNVTRLLRFRAPDFGNALFVETIEQMHEADNQETDEDERYAAVVKRRIEERGGRCAADFRDRSPDQALTRERQTGLSRVEGDEGGRGYRAQKILYEGQSAERQEQRLKR
jgi:hypothetical protein